MQIVDQIPPLSPDLNWLILVGFFIGGMAIGYFYRKFYGEKIIGEAEKFRDRVLEDAEREAAVIRREEALKGIDESHRYRQEIEREIESKRAEVARGEEKIRAREEALTRRSDLVEREAKDLYAREEKLKAEGEGLAAEHVNLTRRLESLAHMTEEEARGLFLREVEDEARSEAARRVRVIESEAQADGEHRAVKILLTVMGRVGARTATEHAAYTVQLPNEQIKGKIIGREGRNIREFERATGVDLIIDETPQTVMISSFDPVRRETARIALAELIADGRIHPSRIEEAVERARRTVDEEIRKSGEEAVYDLGIHNMRGELVRALGAMKFRSSYGQNMLEHSKEVAQIAALLAAELGLDTHLVKRAALLHDIGKSVSHEVEGPHARVGAELARRYGESPAVVDAVAGHHGEVEQTIEAVCVGVADAISGARPGARVENAEAFIKRLKDLEQIAQAEPGVERAYAIQAGREVRVFVKHDKVSDREAAEVAKRIAKRIGSEVEFPGQIKVLVIRETRITEYAH